MTRKRLHATLLAVLAPIVLGLGVGWWWMAAGRFPLKGDYHHDFGDVPITGRSASVSHTFTLVNKRDETVVIKSIGKGCGCTDVSASTTEVPPGGTVDIDVTLNLTAAGKKRTDITMYLEDFGILKLWLKAVGRQGIALEKNQYEIDLVEGQTTPVSFFAALQDTDEPPATPVIETPANVTAQFVRWDLVQVRDRARQRPARWRGRMQVTLVKDDLPADAQVIVRVSEAPLVFLLSTPSSPARAETKTEHVELGAPETPDVP